MNLIKRIYRLFVNLKQATHRLICTIIVSLAALLCFNPSAYADRFYVDGATGSDSDDGTTWALAFATVQKALLEATPGPHEIWVAQGTYVPDIGPGQTEGDRDSTFDLVDKVEMYGGFEGNETALSQRDPAEFITILSGAITDPNSAVCGPGNGDCFEAHDDPGCEDGDCCATVCEAQPFCCAFEWDFECVALANSMCDGGEVPYGAYHVVTAIDVDNTTRIDGFTITAGSAGGLDNDARGGGMFIADADVLVIRCLITDNAASAALSSGAGEGGGVNVAGNSDPTFVNCVFLSNFADEGGGFHADAVVNGGFIGVSSATLVNCLFAGNEAIKHGGAIDIGSDDPAELNVYNCTFVDNTAGDGGAGEGGGAFWIEEPEDPQDDGPTVLITNCILWDNFPNEIEEIGGTIIVRYTNIEGGVEAAWDGGDNIDQTPTFGPGAGNYRLTNDSRGVDEGTNNDVQCDAFDIDNDGDDCSTPQDTPDLDLGVRIVDSTVDMGAYESVPCPWDIAPVGNLDCKVGIADFLRLLKLWGNPYGITDFLDLLAAWGPCQCDPDATSMSLQDELDDACLTQDDWDEYEDVMTDPGSSQADKDRYDCWMTHYIEHCDRCTCNHTATCPGDDPFN